MRVLFYMFPPVVIIGLHLTCCSKDISTENMSKVIPEHYTRDAAIQRCCVCTFAYANDVYILSDHDYAKLRRMWDMIPMYRYISRGIWVLFLLLLWSLVMYANNRVHYGLMVVLICFHITLPHYHHYVDLSEGIELLKCLSSTFCRLFVWD